MGLCGFTRIADIDRSVLLERPRVAAFGAGAPTSETAE